MTLHAIIDTTCEGYAKMSKHKRKAKKKEKEKVKTHAEYDRNRLFHATEQTRSGVTQTTNVTVTVNPEKEGCWDGIKACFGFGARAAAS